MHMYEDLGGGCGVASLVAALGGGRAAREGARRVHGVRGGAAAAAAAAAMAAICRPTSARFTRLRVLVVRQLCCSCGDWAGRHGGSGARLRCGQLLRRPGRAGGRPRRCCCVGNSHERANQLLDCALDNFGVSGQSSVSIPSSILLFVPFLYSFIHSFSFLCPFHSGADDGPCAAGCCCCCGRRQPRRAMPARTWR